MRDNSGGCLSLMWPVAEVGCDQWGLLLTDCLWLAVDLLCRVLADVHKDSSEIVDSLLSTYQRKLLNMVYLDDHLNRDKFNVIM